MSAEESEEFISSQNILPNSNRTVTIDDLLNNHIGSFGKYQKRLAVYFCLILAPLTSVVLFSNYLLLLVPPHSCAQHLQLPQLENISLIEPFRNKTVVYKQCEIIRSNYNATAESGSCDQWVYDYTSSYITAPSEFNWVCENRWKSLLPHVVFAGGALLGSLLIGDLADRFGRIPTLATSYFLVGILGILSNYVVHSYSSFLVVRGLYGIVATVITVAPVLVTEFIGAEWRFSVVLGFFVINSSFNGLLPWLAYWLGNWKTYNLMTSALMFTVPLISIFTLESPRLLLSKGKTQEAVKILKKIADINGKIVPQWAFSGLSVGIEKSNVSFFSVFKYKYLLRSFLLISFTGFFYILAYQGHNIFVSSLGANPLMTYTIFAAFDIISAICSRYLADFVGRKRSISICLFLSGFLYMCSIVIPSEWEKVSMTAGFLARVGITTVVNVNSIYTTEVFPTVVRGRCLATRLLFLSAGTAVSPLVVGLTFAGESTPLFCFGVFTVLAGTCMLFVPETLGKALPETLEDANKLSKDILPGWFLRKTRT